MNQVLSRMSHLPKELQDLISEYNVEHRPNMRFVLDDLTNHKPYSLICNGCGIGKIGICLYSYIPEEFVCSKKCVKSYIESLPSHMQGWY
jgi:hypothetical protein